MLTLATSGCERVKPFYDDKSAEWHLPPETRGGGGYLGGGGEEGAQSPTPSLTSKIFDTIK